MATGYLLGAPVRRVEELARSLGVTNVSKTQVSLMAAGLNEMVAGSRPAAGCRAVYVHVDQRADRDYYPEPANSTTRSPTTPKKNWPIHSAAPSAGAIDENLIRVAGSRCATGECFQTTKN